MKQDNAHFQQFLTTMSNDLMDYNFKSDIAFLNTFVNT